MIKKRIINNGIKPTLSFAYEEFKTKNKLLNLSPATIQSYQATMNRFMGYLKEDMSCDMFTSKTLDGFTARLMKEQ